jgi:hypothetical protein
MREEGKFGKEELLEQHILNAHGYCHMESTQDMEQGLGSCPQTYWLAGPVEDLVNYAVPYRATPYVCNIRSVINYSRIFPRSRPFPTSM